MIGDFVWSGLRKEIEDLGWWFFFFVLWTAGGGGGGGCLCYIGVFSSTARML